MFPSSSKTFTEELAKSNHDLKSVAQSVLENERISVDAGVQLIESPHLIELGHLANFVRQRKAYDVAINQGCDQSTAIQRTETVWWNTNVHLNPTNVCIGSCDFCSFARRPGEEGAYTMSIEEAVSRAAAARAEGASEVHIVGGLNPKTLIEYYSDLMQSIKRDVPGIHIKAFTAVEIEFFSQFARHSDGRKMNDSEIFDALIAAGLDSMPGGGAEIFSRAVRDEMCPDKIPAERWVEIHNLAHQKGLKTNATMLAGIGEEAAERVDHMDVLRRAQDTSLADPIAQKAGGRFQTFIPLSCHYEGNDLLERGVKALTGHEQLKNIAVSRLMLDNFDNIKAYWIQLGEKLAQIALSFGANDLDGTVKAERITFAAGAKHRSMAENSLVRMIESARLIPMERDSLYTPINESKFAVAA